MSTSRAISGSPNLPLRSRVHEISMCGHRRRTTGSSAMCGDHTTIAPKQTWLTMATIKACSRYPSLVRLARNR